MRINNLLQSRRPQSSAPKTNKTAEELRAENELLKAQLKKNKREWPEFVEAVETLKLGIMKFINCVKN